MKDITIERVREHYVIRVGGAFWATAESYAEALEEVAELAGFSNANYLLRVFKKSTGKTIGQYRKQIKF